MLKYDIAIPTIYIYVRGFRRNYYGVQGVKDFLLELGDELVVSTCLSEFCLLKINRNLADMLHIVGLNWKVFYEKIPIPTCFNSY